MRTFYEGVLGGSGLRSASRDSGSAFGLPASCVAGPGVPLALRLRASCPSQRSATTVPFRVAKQVRLGRRRSPGGSLRVAGWSVCHLKQHTTLPEALRITHLFMRVLGSGVPRRRTRSPSTLAAYSQTHPHTGPFRGSAIVPTQSPSFFPSSEEVPTLPYIRTRRQPYSPECGGSGILRTSGVYGVLRSSDAGSCIAPVL